MFLYTTTYFLLFIVTVIQIPHIYSMHQNAQLKAALEVYVQHSRDLKKLDRKYVDIQEANMQRESSKQGKHEALAIIQQLCNKGVSLECLDEFNITAFHYVTSSMFHNEHFLDDYPVELITLLITNARFEPIIRDKKKEKVRNTIIGALWAFKQLNLTQDNIKLRILSLLPHKHLHAAKGLCRVLAERGDISESYMQELVRIRVVGIQKVLRTCDEPITAIGVPPLLRFFSTISHCFPARPTAQENILPTWPSLTPVLTDAERSQRDTILSLLDSRRLQKDFEMFKKAFPDIGGLPQDNLALGMYHNCVRLLKEGAC